MSGFGVRAALSPTLPRGGGSEIKLGWPCHNIELGRGGAGSGCGGEG